MLTAPSLLKQPIKVPNLKSLRPFSPSHEYMKGLVSKCSMENRFLLVPSDILFASLYVCIFQPRNFTSWGSEAVNRRLRGVGGGGGSGGPSSPGLTTMPESPEHSHSRTVYIFNRCVWGGGVYHEDFSFRTH